LFCVRFMDDVVELAPTRWKLRRAVKTLNRVFQALGLEKHPQKTFIGRADKGFDFLGFRFSPNGTGLAPKSIENFASRLTRLYEQKKTAPEGAALLRDYVMRWLRWVRVDLSTC